MDPSAVQVLLLLICMQRSENEILTLQQQV